MTGCGYAASSAFGVGFTFTLVSTAPALTEQGAEGGSLPVSIVALDPTVGAW